MTADARASARQPAARGHRPGRGRASAGLAARLLGAQLVVVVAGSTTLALVAISLAPRLFTVHLDRAGETDPAVRAHAEEAFSYALAIALGIAAVVSVCTALVVSAFVVRRLATPVANLAAAADELASGNYRVRVPDAGLGGEFDRLTGAFTRMGDRLATTEAVRHQLLSDLAHELRTPLGTLAAHVDGLEDGVVPASSGTWQIMRDQLDRMQRLAGDLAQLSAAEEHALELEVQDGDLAQIARAAVDAARPRFQAKGVTLTCEGTEHVPVLADHVRLQQILGNLLDNALRHTPAGRCVQVRTGLTGRFGVVAIEDDGSGIPVHELQAVFDRFHRVDSARARAEGGSGLGLTIARAIAGAHGGTLTAQSDGVGTGATLTLRIPRVAGPLP